MPFFPEFFAFSDMGEMDFVLLDCEATGVEYKRISNARLFLICIRFVCYNEQNGSI